MAWMRWRVRAPFAPPIENFRLTQLMCWSFFIRIDASIKVHKIRAKCMRKRLPDLNCRTKKAYMI